jgi:hypothetical protein
MSPLLRALVRMLGGDPRRRRPNLLVAIYRWRWEIAAAGGLVALIRLGVDTHWVAPVLAVSAVAAALALWPALRHHVADRCRSVLVQHRLRSAFHELCITTWAGRSPAIFWSAPRGDGLRMYLLCPAGIAAHHFTPDVLETLAAACDVPEVRLETDARHPALVVLVVVTRLPTGGQTIEGRT